MAEFWAAALWVGVQCDYGEFVFLHRVPEPRSGKNRVHVDLTGGPRATEVPRLVGLGATVVGEHEVPGLRWTVLADPEGNQFCLGEHPE